MWQTLFILTHLVLIFCTQARVFFFLPPPFSPFALSFCPSFKKMGVLLEEKALGEINFHSLEKEVSAFLGEDIGESRRSLEGETEEYESDYGSDSHDPVERTLYWESQEALLQV